MSLYAIKLAGGAVDYACTACVTEARRERGAELLGVASTDVQEACVYCGAEPNNPEGN